MSNAECQCESCGMPVEVGPYCSFCVDENGRLQDFATRFERMVAWTMRQDGGVGRTEAEKKTLAYMAGMPAWRDHPSIVAQLKARMPPADDRCL